MKIKYFKKHIHELGAAKETEKGRERETGERAFTVADFLSLPLYQFKHAAGN